MTPKAALLWGLVASLLLASTDAFSSLHQPCGLQCRLRSKAPLGTSPHIPIVADRPSGLTCMRTPCAAADRFNIHSTAKIRYTALQSSKSATSDNSSSSSPKSSSSSLSLEAVVYMTLLAFQFGLQPGLVRKFTPQTICRSTVVMMQEILKVVISAFVLFGGSKNTRKEALKGWNLKTALMIGGLPAALYCVQNMAALMAYQNLEPLTFNVLNQTKTLSAALCCYLIMGRKQSKTQMASLVLLLTSALVIEKVISLSAPFVSFGGGGGVAATATQHFTQGVAPILLASFISGLAGALAQKNLQSSSGDAKGGRNPYLFNMEMNSASALILAASLLFTADGSRIRAAGFFDGWTPQTWIPIITNALGGIIVGLVTKHAGAVRKGFALIFGILISGLWEVQTVGISKEQIIGGIFAALSLWMHTAYPYKSKTDRKKEE
eukprot:CAMPEP_0197717224 /NCGR_PEP_ID=MMETSP1434-20131217/1832_1 /TAXON_ID=265543 /ORGANISM="Minutocellus polymorphus, Strain CCMP3303" /LENGTH=435 /DNA_ID=CAMNT_0043301719 /DNA_START=22 /DNA_END=1329 /DNA_ORIENTATION=-